MASELGSEQAAIELLRKCNLKLESCKVLQSLWAGYGHICRVIAKSDASSKPLAFILKHIDPPAIRSNGALPNEGHIRKILSYQVEEFFYTRLAPQMPKEIAVASCIASMGTGENSNATAMLLTDLQQTHPISGEKRAKLSEQQTYAALEWLASFHGFWWTMTKDLERQKLCLPPLEHFQKHRITTLGEGGVWLNGGYTYLATRRSEYISLASDETSEWSALFCSGSPSLAELASAKLSPEIKANSEYVTLIHGDVKSENLFSSKDGKSVAFFDFQYIGLGLGVCDLAKLFTCSVPQRLLPATQFMADGEKKMLRFYHEKLEKTSGRKYPWNVFIMHWEAALLDWLRFQASWGMWGNTEWLEERCRGIISEGNQWLNSELKPN